MFDLIAHSNNRPLRERSPRSKLVSIVAHAIVVPLALLLPVLLTTAPPTAPATMIAFVALPELRPPSAPAPRAATAAPAAARPMKNARTAAAPIEAPNDVRPEEHVDLKLEQPAGPGSGASGGVTGGVEGGVPAGNEPRAVEGRLAGEGMPAAPPPPPLAPSPVRVGGRVGAPALVHRVEPVYPALAESARISGVVILEATVSTDGCVTSVNVLSGNAILAGAAVDAVTQWQYRPLTANGVALPFVLTVVLSFTLR